MPKLNRLSPNNHSAKQFKTIDNNFANQTIQLLMKKPNNLATLPAEPSALQTPQRLLAIKKKLNID